MAIGYVLGSKAGRERYEQIMRLASKAADNPAVQGAGGFLRAKVSSLVPIGKRNQVTRPDAAYLVDDAEPLSTTPAPARTPLNPTLS